MPAHTAPAKRSSATKTTARSSVSATQPTPTTPLISSVPPPPSSPLAPCVALPPSTPSVVSKPSTGTTLLQPPLSMLPARLIAAKRNMMSTGFYLGDNSVRENVHWVRDGRANRLAIKQSEPVGDAEPCADGDSSNYPTPPPEGFEVAPVCAVARISNRDFWLTSDAGYRGISEICKAFSEIKASCAVEQPDVAPFKDDYPIVIRNLEWLVDKVATPSYAAKKGLFAQANTDGSHFKVRHKLFEKLGRDEIEACTSSDNEGENEGDEGSKENDVFMIQNWPTSNDVAASALEEIKETHRVVPVPAYGLDGKLINPQSYRRQLEGALVEVYFALSHWSIAPRNGSAGNDAYTADIVMIRVLAAPNATVAATPRKRKAVDLYVDPNAPPTKRFRRT